jgi:hypothetical protein
MSADEMESFEKDPLFEVTHDVGSTNVNDKMFQLKVKLRTWDEKSKLVGYQVPVLASS